MMVITSKYKTFMLEIQFGYAEEVNCCYLVDSLCVRFWKFWLNLRGLNIAEFNSLRGTAGKVFGILLI